MAIEKIGDQFKGLDMSALIGGPLTAACKSQLMLAQATCDFITQIGFYPESHKENPGGTRKVDFSFERNVFSGVDELGHDIYSKETVSLAVPALAIVNIPSLMIDEVDITFNMEVSNSELHTDSIDTEAGFSSGASGGAGIGWASASFTASVSGKVATSVENTRKSDNSAKYNVNVHAKQFGTPEGLSRVLDIIASAVAPESITSPQARLDSNNQVLEGLVVKKRKASKELKQAQLDLSRKREELDLYLNENNKHKESTDIKINEIRDGLTIECKKYYEVQ